MKWLMRLLGHDKVPLQVQEGLDAAQEAQEATKVSRAAARSYWAAIGKPAGDDLVRVTGELTALEKQRQERRRD